jgi:hypothetical protein
MAKVPLSMPCCERKFYRGNFLYLFVFFFKFKGNFLFLVALDIQRTAFVRWRALMDRTLI